MIRFTSSFLTKGLVVGALVILTHSLYSQQRPATPQPDARYHVDKQYDEHGNLLRYDSVYTWSWSSDGRALNMDSLMQAFTWPGGQFSPPDFSGSFGDDFFRDFSFPSMPFFDRKGSWGFSMDSSFFYGPGARLEWDSLQRMPAMPELDTRFRELMEQHFRMLEQFSPQPFQHAPGPLPSKPSQARPREIRI